MLKRLACVAVAFAMVLSVVAVGDTETARAVSSYTIKPKVVCTDSGGRFDVRIAAGEKPGATTRFKGHAPMMASPTCPCTTDRRKRSR